jgi:hypothetical protein
MRNTEMKYELFTRVALAVDIPEHRLKKGDVVTIVDYLPAGKNPEPGLALEVFNVLGDTIAVTSVAESEVRPLQANEIQNARRLSRDA